MRRKTALEGTTLVYSFSCRPADEASKALADRQIDLGIEYKNRLIRNGMIHKRKLLKLFDSWGAPPPRGKRVLSDEQKQAVQALKELRNRWEREDRAHFVECGLWYGTYWLSEQAAKQSVSARWKENSDDLAGVGFDRGLLGAGIQGSEILICDNRELRGVKKVQLQAESRFPTLTIFCGEGRQTLWTLKMHRPLPKGRVLKTVVSRQRVSSQLNAKKKYDYFVQFTLNTADEALQPKQAKPGLRAGLDSGWWSESDTIRVYDLVDENGHHERKLLPQELTSRHFHTHSLESIRDRMRGGWKMRTWVELSKHDSDLNEIRKRMAHLDTWIVAQERSAVRARNEFYKGVARDLCSRYAEIYVEDMRLDELATHKSRRYSPENRVLGAPGMFRATLKQVARRYGTSIVEVETAWTTQTCSLCGDGTLWENPGEREHVCAACGETYERPWNSARNILHRGTARKVDADAAE